MMEMALDLATMLAACRTLIQHNGRLSERLVEAERIVTNQMVNLLAKDIEIHELKGKTPND